MAKSDCRAYEANLNTIASSASMIRAYLPVGDCPVCGARLFEQKTGYVECEKCDYCSEH